MLALWLIAGPGLAACGDIPLLAAYRSTPPLLAHEADSSLIVLLHADGCASLRMPAQRIGHGSYRKLLAVERQAQFASGLRDAQLDRIDPQALKSRLHAQLRAKQSRDELLHRVLDENLLEFVIPGGQKDLKPAQLRWSSLHSDLLNAPDDEHLQALAALREQFEALAEELRTAGVKVAEQ